MVAGEFELSFWLTVILILLILFPHFGLLCTAHQFGLHYMLIFIDSLGHFLGIVVDLAIIFMVKFGVDNALFLTYFVIPA